VLGTLDVLFLSPVRWCCWAVIIVILFSTIVGIPCGIALICYTSKKGLKSPNVHLSVQ